MITWLFSSISDMMYSLFQKYNALSATWTPYKVKYNFVGLRIRSLYSPESVDWRHTWQSAWTVVLGFWRTAPVRSHPESPRSHPRTSPGEKNQNTHSSFASTIIQIQIQTETVNVDQYLLLRARLGPELQQSLDHLEIKCTINELHLNCQTEMS